MVIILVVFSFFNVTCFAVLLSVQLTWISLELTLEEEPARLSWLFLCSVKHQWLTVRAAVEIFDRLGEVWWNEAVACVPLAE